MGFMDKLKQTASKAATSAKQSVSEGSSKMKEWNAERKEMDQPLEGAIKRYSVTYVSGLDEYPKKKSGAIGMNIMPDRFIFTPTISTKDWFKEYEIPYDKISELNIEKRTITTSEMLLGAGDSANQQQENVICILYTDAQGQKLTLRVEMLTGVTIYNQAAACREFTALLRQHEITDKFQSSKKEGSNASSGGDVLAQLEKLNKLKEAGILTEEEFNATKTDLLSKL